MIDVPGVTCHLQKLVSAHAGRSQRSPITMANACPSSFQWNIPLLLTAAVPFQLKHCLLISSPQTVSSLHVQSAATAITSLIPILLRLRDTRGLIITVESMTQFTMDPLAARLEIFTSDKRRLIFLSLQFVDGSLWKKNIDGGPIFRCLYYCKILIHLQEL
jgi:hypothetical protein